MLWGSFASLILQPAVLAPRGLHDAIAGTRQVSPAGSARSTATLPPLSDRTARLPCLRRACLLLSSDGGRDAALSDHPVAPGAGDRGDRRELRPDAHRLSGSHQCPARRGGTDRDDDRFWKAGLVYLNRSGLAIMVASRLGVGWTFQPQEPIRMADHRRSHGRASRPRRSRSRQACKRPGTAPPRSPHRAIRANGRSLASSPAARQHPRSRPAGECFLAGYLSSPRSNSPVWYASTTTWTRSRRPSFWRMCVTWVLTVVSLM